MHLTRWLKRLSRSHVIFAFGFMATLFLLIDMCMVFWRAMQAGGTVTVGDTMNMLTFELFLVVPIALLWMALLLIRRK